MRLAAVLFCVVFATAIAHAAAGNTLEGATAQGWHAEGTDDLSTSLRSIDGQHGKAVCLDFDFNGVSGGATLQKTVPIDWPDNFMLSFDLRGSMPANDLQVKLIDDSGDNVWWYRREAFVPTANWQTIEVRRHQVEFAWGPGADRMLRHTAKLAFTVYAGHGGKGELCLDNLRLQALPPEPKAVASAPAETPNARFEQRAKQVPRGLYPRGFSGEQSYWTVVGVDGDADHSALISEDGAVEVRRGGWSIEPMIFDGQHVIDWAKAEVTQSLLDGYLPIPSVHWRAGELSLETTLIAAGDGDASELLLRYMLSNSSAQSRTVTLALLQRPFQVNPPTQFLNTPGGISPIHELAWDGRRVQVNGGLQVIPLQPGATFVAGTDAAGALPERLLRGERPAASMLRDDSGYAQGALLYTLTIPAHGQRVVGLAVPASASHFAPDGDGLAWLQRQHDAVAAHWRESLNRVTLSLPASQRALLDTTRSAVAQILMSRQGPALRPGTRSYGRSWVRDGAMMTEGLLRSGHGDVAAQFVHWYAPYQFRSGKVPCCVDTRGSDPVPENDSHGELIFAVAELWRYRQDRAELETLWPHVERAVAYMDTLRASERTDANRQAGREALYGLMPASISHEGYSAKPMHSYWDDFWALIGYKDAALLAQALGKSDEAARIGQSRDQFRGDLLASIKASVAQHHIDYLPGAAELGDFDATSTTVALSPGDGLSWLPRDLLERTFERYWTGFIQRRDGPQAWDAYTPYELRVAASFVRLGWRDRLGPLLSFFMADRRPAAWNQWAEVVGRNPREPRFVGDMPHAWIASDYLRSVYDMFAYERPGDHALVLGAGLDPAWFVDTGVGIEHLRTPYGELSYRLRAERGRLVLMIPAGLRVPPGGLVFRSPYTGEPAASVTLNGKPVAWRAGEVVIRQLPATLELDAR
jgi:hypothetical protein